MRKARIFKVYFLGCGDLIVVGIGEETDEILAFGANTKSSVNSTLGRAIGGGNLTGVVTI